MVRTDAGYDPSHRHPDDPDYSPEQGLCSYKFQYYDTCAGQHGLDSCNEADLHAVHAALDLNLDAVLANEADWVTIVEQTEYSESLLHEDFSAVNARYVRLVIDPPGSLSFFSFLRLRFALAACGRAYMAGVPSTCCTA